MKRTVFVMLAVLLSTAFGTTWYVHPDSTQDSIQPCLDSCGAGDTVLVAAGTYHERLVWPNTQNIKLLSESGRDSTVIDGDSSGIVITIEVDVDTTTAIEGFTITGGYSNAEAGGILVPDGAPMIRNNTLMGNEARWGGAIAAWSNDSIYIVNNRFIRDRATSYGGAASLGSGTAFLVGNLFEQNLADTWAGAVSLEGEGGLIQGNVFNGNRTRSWGGGLYSEFGTTASIVGNTFTYDTALYGSGALGFVLSGRQTVTGNTVRYCYSPRGAAAYCYNSSATFVGDTFTDNTATGSYGIICCQEGSSPSFSRCLIADNSMPVSGALVTVDSSSPTVDSCTITGNGCAGVYVGTGSRLSISNSNICGNLDWGVSCTYYAESIDACNNWWGDSTGPFHPDSNPGGLGDAVSDGVFFKPWLRDSVSLPGVCESHDRAPVGLPTQVTLVRGVLFLPEASSHKLQAARLLDISGRKVLDLRPGANDVRALAPGVYFVCSKGQRDQGIEGSSVRKVVITR